MEMISCHTFFHHLANDPTTTTDLKILTSIRARYIRDADQRTAIEAVNEAFVQWRESSKWLEVHDYAVWLAMLRAEIIRITNRLAKREADFRRKHLSTQREADDKPFDAYERTPSPDESPEARQLRLEQERKVQQVIEIAQCAIAKLVLNGSIVSRFAEATDLAIMSYLTETLFNRSITWAEILRGLAAEGLDVPDKQRLSRVWRVVLAELAEWLSNN